MCTYANLYCEVMLYLFEANDALILDGTVAFQRGNLSGEFLSTPSCAVELRGRGQEPPLLHLYRSLALLQQSLQLQALLLPTLPFGIAALCAHACCNVHGGHGFGELREVARQLFAELFQARCHTGAHSTDSR